MVQSSGINLYYSYCLNRRVVLTSSRPGFSNMTIRSLIAVLVFVVCLSVSVFSQQALKVGSLAPQFSGTSSDGIEYDLSRLRGKIVVVTFWSVRCEICRVELPRLDEVVRQHDPEQVEFLALSAESDEVVTTYLQSRHFRFKSIPNSFGPMLQYADRNRSGGIMMPFPSFYVIGRSGRIEYRSNGYDKTGAIDAVIKQLLTVRQ
jgi:peroxiredoxin